MPGQTAACSFSTSLNCVVGADVASLSRELEFWNTKQFVFIQCIVTFVVFSLPRREHFISDKHDIYISSDCQFDNGKLALVCVDEFEVLIVWTDHILRVTNVVQLYIFSLFETVHDKTESGKQGSWTCAFHLLYSTALA